MFVSHTADKNIAEGKNVFRSPSGNMSTRVPTLVDGVDTEFIELRGNEWVQVDLTNTEHIRSVRLHLKPSKTFYSHPFSISSIL